MQESDESMQEDRKKKNADRLEALYALDRKIGQQLDNFRVRSAVSKPSEEENRRVLEAMEEHLREHSSVHASYVVRGAVMRCRCGTHQRRLNLPYSHGVFCGGNPMVHALDCECGEDKNISSFGICQGGTLSAGENITLGAEVHDEDGLAIPGKTDGIVSGIKCIPLLLTAWMATHPSTKILINDGRMDRPEDQAEAVTTNSFLVCQHGGVIEFKTDGQEIRSDTGSQGGAVAGATAALGATAKNKHTPAKGKDNTARRTAVKTPEFTLQRLATRHGATMENQTMSADDGSGVEYFVVTKDGVTVIFKSTDFPMTDAAFKKASASNDWYVITKEQLSKMSPDGRKWKDEYVFTNEGIEELNRLLVKYGGKPMWLKTTSNSLLY